MIELTDEMVRALWSALPSEVQEGREPDDVEAWVDALLAVVERDQAGPCSATLPRLTEYGDLWCQLRQGHLGDHEMGPTRWKERDQPHICPTCGSTTHDGDLKAGRNAVDRGDGPEWCDDEWHDQDGRS